MVDTDLGGWVGSGVTHGGRGSIARGRHNRSA